MQYYPICLNITNKRCIVVGGGEVGARKAEGLLICGAKVTVISPNLSPLLVALKRQGGISHIAADYDAAYLEGAFLVMGATDSEAVNDRIAKDARARGILVNIADDPQRCDFMLPAVVRRGDLLAAVSTGGKSPALAKKLKKDLLALFGPEYAVLLDIMGDLRRQRLARPIPAAENKEIFTALIESDILRHIREGDKKALRECLRQIAGADVEISSI